MSERMRIVVLGCTGSIGRQTLDVCRQNPDKLDVVALSVHGSTDGLVEAARAFGARSVCVSDPAHAADPVLDELPDSCELSVGPDALIELCERDDVDCVLNAVVGAAGLRASYAALRAGKRLALANKESLVVGGDLLMPLAARDQLLPVDSEHGAIFQCLVGEQRSRVHAIWLTCSGGPFFGMTRQQLQQVTKADALKHPNWKMGAKITIDCATLMNKGLEVIEAMRLYQVPLEQVDVVIHRQSIVHSMVEFTDGAVMAQMGTPDMRLPIQLALTYPQRLPCPVEGLDLLSCGSLSFAAPDLENFPCLALAYQCAAKGGTACPAMNGANEEAVAMFLADEIGFYDIYRLVSQAVEQVPFIPNPTLEEILEADRLAREAVRKLR